MDKKDLRDFDKQAMKWLNNQEFECIFCGKSKKYKNMTQVIEKNSKKSKGVACKNCDEQPEKTLDDVTDENGGYKMEKKFNE